MYCDFDVSNRPKAMGINNLWANSSFPRLVVDLYCGWALCGFRLFGVRGGHASRARGYFPFLRKSPSERIVLALHRIAWLQRIAIGGYLAGVVVAQWIWIKHRLGVGEHHEGELLEDAKARERGSPGISPRSMHRAVRGFHALG